MYMNKIHAYTRVWSAAIMACALFFATGCGEDVNEGYGDLTVETGVDGTYVIDTAASNIHWYGKKVIGGHDGEIRISEGYLTYKDSVLVGGEIVVDMHTIRVTDIDDDGLNEHLMDADFFNAPEFPTSKFVIRETKIVEGDYVLSGDLTIMNYTNTIEMKVDMNATTEQVTGSTTFSFDRTQWGIHYNSASIFSDVGDNFILDDVELEIVLVANKED